MLRPKLNLPPDPMPSTTSSLPQDLKIGVEPDFSIARNFLSRADYTDSHLLQLLQIPQMSDLRKVDWNKLKTAEIQPLLQICLTLFLRCLPVNAVEMEKCARPEEISALRALGLVRDSRSKPGEIIAPFWVYPVAGFLIVSDRVQDPEGFPFEPDGDMVFPAIYGGTLRFLELLPKKPGAETLDLCGGSGIGALHLARSASRSASSDLTQRSALFAEFNSRLNAAPIESLCGDLYQPVKGRQFDLVTAHPPFVPAIGANMVYRDAGETGEEITRRVLEELPNHLRVDGTCVVLCVARDTKEGTFEQRARKWLGADGEFFDIVFGLEKVLSVAEVVESIRKRGKSFSTQETEDLTQRLQALGTEQFVYGALFLRRFPKPVEQKPSRIRILNDCGSDAFERILQWRQLCRLPETMQRLADAKPLLSPFLELHVRHAMQEGVLTPNEYVFVVEEEVSSALRPDLWVVPLLLDLKGETSLRTIFEKHSQSGKMPPDFTLEAFVSLVSGLIERGLVRWDRINSNE